MKWFFSRRFTLEYQPTAPHRYTLAVFAVVLFIYGVTTAPALHTYDSTEFTLGAYTLGIVHASGYPLYLLLLHGFTMLPLPLTLAVKAHLFSAVWGAVTCTLLYRLILFITRSDPLWVAGGVLLYAFAPAIWRVSTVTEVYTLHTAIVAAALLLYVHWESHPRPWQVLAVGGVFGIGAAHHLASVLVAAVVLPVMLWRTRWIVRAWAVGLFALLGGLPYLYFPLRWRADPAFNMVGEHFTRDLTALPDIIWMIRGGMFADLAFDYTIWEYVQQLGQFGLALTGNFLGGGLLLGVIGAIDLWRIQRRICGMLLVIFGLQAGIFSGYNVFDKWEMFHTAYLVWIVFIMAGVHWLALQLPRRSVRWTLAVFVVAQGVIHWNGASHFRDTSVHEQATQTITALPPNALLIATWTEAYPIRYLQMVDGIRTDVQLYNMTSAATGIRDRHPDDWADRAFQDLRTHINCHAGPVYITQRHFVSAVYRTDPVLNQLHHILVTPEDTCPRYSSSP